MNEYSSLNDESVIAFNDRNLIKMKQLREAIKEAMERGDRFKDTISQHLSSSRAIKIPDKNYCSIDRDENEKNGQIWLENGVICELLKLGSNEWKKGKIYFSINVDFYPDEPEIPKPPESPLDDIRELMNKDN